MSTNKKTKYVHGPALFCDPETNRFTSFSLEERNSYGIVGFIPPAEETQEKQIQRELNQLRKKDKSLEKYLHLMNILVRNQRLFYQLVIEHAEECVPLVYTPVVGEACLQYSEIIQNPFGLFISLKERGNIEKILTNWKQYHPEVKAIVVTDGERILGLGDLGANGMGIPIGKLQLYVTMGGIHPNHTLPITLDVGTNNEYLKDKNEFYVGLRQPRERGEGYDSFIEEFVQAVKKCYGVKCLIQWEDFGNSTAFKILQKYRNNTLCFNDDIQGTASVTLAGLISSLKANSKLKKLGDHVFCFFGAGEAGVGIAELLADVLAREEKVKIEEARKKIWLIDSKGLICDQGRLDSYQDLASHKLNYVHILDERMKKIFQNKEDFKDLVKIIKAIHATTLIGASAAAGSFNETVLQALCENCERPNVFVLSNPTYKAECTAEQAINWSRGKCLFCSGSPFPPVTYENKVHQVRQVNNLYIFPGVALGCLCFEIKMIPDELFEVAARTLADCVTTDDVAQGSLFPRVASLREVSIKIASSVGKRAFQLGLSYLAEEPTDYEQLCRSQIYSPKY